MEKWVSEKFSFKYIYQKFILDGATNHFNWTMGIYMAYFISIGISVYWDDYFKQEKYAAIQAEFRRTI